MKFFKYFILTGSLALLVFLFLPQAASASTLALSPTSNSATVGNTFTVNVMLDTTSQAIYGVDIYSLHFNPAILQVVDADGSTAGVQIAAGSLMPTNQYNSVNNSTGVIQFSQTPSTTGSNYTGSGVLATITFQVVGAGTSAVTFDFTSGSTVDTNVAGLYADTLTAVTNGSYTGTAAGDTTAPSVPAGLTATVISSTQINLSWTASTDNVAVTGYKVYRGGSQIATTTLTSYSNTGLSAGTAYSYTVAAYDAAGNTSAQTSAANITTQSSPDTTAPTVSITNPSSSGQTLSGTITVAASASDPVVAGQVNSGIFSTTLLIDGTVFASSSSASVSASLDTSTLTNASHTLTARARDNAGNITTSSAITFTAYNLSNATRYPRSFNIASLEGLSAVPNNTAVTATVISPANQTVLSTQSLTADASGNVTVAFQSAFPQVVSVRISVSGYLSRVLTNIDTTVNTATPVATPVLYAGDFNNDGIINSLDFSSMNSHWNQNYPSTDINKDGLINSLDFAVLKNNWNKVGE
jgi:chitodextrinase